MNISDMNQIINHISDKINVSSIYLFGSVLTKRFNDESDIDIAIIPDDEISELNLFDLCLDLGAVLNRDIHLINFLTTDLILKIQILKNKKVIYYKNNEKRIYLEMLAISEYGKLNEEREIILKNRYGENVWMLF
ncbi:MAG TPA: nucleotidyltransferase domain-containing protein [Spirochaetota bacterium]|nr:nucleotidyltransferase domain-containing protein [Spirochaetota bacterium]